MAILDHKDLALPNGSIILVTGTTGYIASNIVKEILDAGFKVRGTARSEEKATKSKKLYGNDENYDVAIVPDMQDDGAFDEAVKGVAAIIHTATVMTFSSNPHEVVTVSIQGAINVMQSALKESKMKRFVFTSSSAVASLPKPNVKFRIDSSTWNTEIEQYAHWEPPFPEDKAFEVYSVSKLMAERAVWKFAKDNKPNFVVNCILPDFNMGRVIDSSGVTAKMVIDAYEGDVPWDFPPHYMIDVVDCARIHIAAAIDNSLSNERILAYSEPFNWNDVLEAIAQWRPNKKVADQRPDLPRDLSEVDNALGATLLKKWWGQDGYTGLKESVKQTLEGRE